MGSRVEKGRGPIRTDRTGGEEQAGGRQGTDRQLGQQGREEMRQTEGDRIVSAKAGAVSC